MADLPIPMAITWYVQPMDKSKAINYVRTRSAWIDKEIIEEQRSAVNKGYDFSILPQELKYSKEETEDVLDHLQNKNQRLYVFTGLVYTYAESKGSWIRQVLRIISTARQKPCTRNCRPRRNTSSMMPSSLSSTSSTRRMVSSSASSTVDDETAVILLPHLRPSNFPLQYASATAAASSAASTLYLRFEASTPSPPLQMTDGSVIRPCLFLPSRTAACNPYAA